MAEVGLDSACVRSTWPLLWMGVECYASVNKEEKSILMCCECRVCRFACSYASMVVVGLGSAWFHSTLLYDGQAADELSMVRALQLWKVSPWMFFRIAAALRFSSTRSYWIFRPWLFCTLRYVKMLPLVGFILERKLRMSCEKVKFLIDLRIRSIRLKYLWAHIKFEIRVSRAPEASDKLEHAPIKWSYAL